jgi:hypothetical protein
MNTPTKLKRSTKDQLVAMLLQETEEKEAQTVRFALCFALGIFIGYALAVY